MADDTSPSDAPEAESSDATAADDAPAAFSTPRLESIRTPVPGDAPAGIDMKYEDLFQTLKAEVDRLGAATGDVDFNKIVDLSTEILHEHSKDISVASYLILGLTRTAGYGGIAEGIAAVRSVTEGFWEDAFPPLRRIRGRQAALQFVAERTSAWIQDNKAEPGDRDALMHAQTEAEALQAFVTESMGENAPAFSGLVRELREQVRRLPKPKPPKEDPPPAKDPEPSAASNGDTADAAPPTPAKPAAPPAASSGGDASFSTPSEAESVVLKVATFLQEQDPYNATAFELRRAVRWNTITTPPPTGVIPPPPSHRRDALAGMVAASNHPLLVTQGEGSFPSPPYHFWLDLQRFLATSLRAIGPPAAVALAVVESTTAALVKRLPSLPTLTFQDGTAFADSLTIAWLDELTASDGDGGGSGTSEASEAAIKEAREQAASGDVPGAVAALMADAGAPRDRFERTVIAAELCLGAGRSDVALGLLETADRAIQTHHLDVWDPNTASKALRLIHTCCTQLVPTASSPERAAELRQRATDTFNRLSRLDPAHAMRSTPAPKK
ncbi:MAG: type VI secretion system protein TssA [Bacteroidota bacterium]